MERKHAISAQMASDYQRQALHYDLFTQPWSDVINEYKTLYKNITIVKKEKNNNLCDHINDYKPKITIIIGPIEAIYRGTDSVHYRAIESNWHVTFPVSDKGTYILCVCLW